MHRGRPRLCGLVVMIGVGMAGCVASNDEAVDTGPSSHFTKREGPIDGGLDVECSGSYDGPDGEVRLAVGFRPTNNSLTGSRDGDELAVMCSASIVDGWRKSGDAEVDYVEPGYTEPDFVRCRADDAVFSVTPNDVLFTIDTKANTATAKIDGQAVQFDCLRYAP